jgi:hypothetical protein
MRFGPRAGVKRTHVQFAQRLAGGSSVRVHDGPRPLHVGVAKPDNASLRSIGDADAASQFHVDGVTAGLERPRAFRYAGLRRKARVVALLRDPVPRHPIALFVVHVQIAAAQQAGGVAGAAMQRQVLLLAFADATGGIFHLQWRGHRRQAHVDGCDGITHGQDEQATLVAIVALLFDGHRRQIPKVRVCEVSADSKALRLARCKINALLWKGECL